MPKKFGSHYLPFCRAVVSEQVDVNVILLKRL